METHLKVDIVSIIALRVLFIPEDYLPIHLCFQLYIVFFLAREIFLRATQACAAQ